MFTDMVLMYGWLCVTVSILTFTLIAAFSVYDWALGRIVERRDAYHTAHRAEQQELGEYLDRVWEMS